MEGAGCPKRRWHLWYGRSQMPLLQHKVIPVAGISQNTIFRAADYALPHQVG